MGETHVVGQGEHLTQITEQYGFRDFRTIWEHPDNAELRQLRRSPNVLLPGDVLHIPAKQTNFFACQTGAKHRFQIGAPALLLRLALRDFGNEPLVDTSCEIQVDGKTLLLRTDANGRVEVPISPTAREATLTFKDPLVPFDHVVPIKIGHLDPVEVLSGQMARLNNLGYITRPLEEVDDTIFAHTVQEFQCDVGLKVSGVCDAATQAKLKQLHGS